MPLYSLNPSVLFKILSRKFITSRSALLHRIISELDLAERRAGSPQELPGRWQSKQVEPVALNVPRGSWRIIECPEPDYVLRLRNNHVSGRGYSTQEVWVQKSATELYIEIGIQGIRIRLDGAWVATIVRRLDARTGRELISLSGRADRSLELMERLANSLTELLGPLKSLVGTSAVATSKSTSGGSQFVTIRRTPSRLAQTGSRVIHLP